MNGPHAPVAGARPAFPASTSVAAKGPRAQPRNNFDALRLTLAAIVAFYHLAVLTRLPQFAFLDFYPAADFAVKGFFVVSGYLVTQSLITTSTVQRYFEKRARRLLPGYVGVVLIATLVGTLMTTLPVLDYITSPQTWKYVFWNLLFLNYKAAALPGLWEGHPVPAVNGALWTIKVEVGFYLVLPLIVLAIRRLGMWPVAITLYLGSVAWMAGFHTLWHATDTTRWYDIANHLPGYISYFTVGVVVQLIRPSARAVWTAGGVALAMYLLGGYYGRFLAEPVLYGAGVLTFALFIPYLGNVARFGDFSYGLYLIHFPLLQAMLHFGLFDYGAAAGFAMFVALLALASFASWKLIEEPFLHRSSHYRAAEQKPAGGAVGPTPVASTNAPAP